MQEVGQRSGALDGLRGAFLAAPIVVHLGLAGSGNGLWLAIGLFFTLSGFLITSLALQEVERTGRLSLPRFWARRLRRLMPASLLVLALTLLVASWLHWPAMSALRADTFAALTWRGNWHQLDGGGYWASFAPSLTQHFWSLSLEEQIFLVMPLVIFAGVALSRRWRPAVTVAALSAAVCAASWTVLWRARDASEIYLSTWTRAGEFAIGCVAAALCMLVPVRAQRPRLATAIVLALAVVEAPVWLLSRGDTVAGLRWGITLSAPAVALAVTLLWRHPTSAAARAFAAWPLTWIGRRSYGIYLLHVPVIELLAFKLGVERLPGWAMVLAVGATVALAAAMYRFVEEPVRVRRVAQRRSEFAGLLAVGALGVVALGAAAGGTASQLLPPAGVTPPLEAVEARPAGVTPPLEAAEAPPSSAVASPATEPPSQPEAAPAPGAPFEGAAAAAGRFPLQAGTALVVGDSTAWVSTGAVAGALAPSGWSVDEVHMVGCPFGGDVRLQSSLDGGAVYTRELGEEPGCDLWWNESLPTWLTNRAPSLVVIVGGYVLAYEVDPDADDEWCRLGDGSGRCETWAAARLHATTERILQYAPNTHIVWTTPGHIDPFGALDVPGSAIDALSSLVRAEAATSSMSVIDLGPWLDAHLDLTVDGTHLGPDGVEALTPWMTDELAAAVVGARVQQTLA
jgi:peptidoglycan/LPS O-acetylase OafA/YrhL